MRAQLRFYEELNDLLPPSRRKKEFDFSFNGKVTLRQVLAALKVPAPSVDLILASGVSVGLSHVVNENERISFYPVFERFDIGSVQRVRPRPLRRTRFAVSTGLSRLATYLRLLGFDTLELGHVPTECEEPRVEKQKRILLTFDRSHLKRRAVSRALCLVQSEPFRQLLDVLGELDLWSAVPLRSSCVFCGAPIGRSGRGEKTQESDTARGARRFCCRSCYLWNSQSKTSRISNSRTSCSNIPALRRG